MSMSSSSPNIETLTDESSYDTSLSYLYKTAIQKGVPLKYLLIYISPQGAQNITTFNLETDQELQFITAFEFIRSLLNEDNTMTLTQIWEFMSKLNYVPLNLIPMWLHAVPEYQVENAALLEQVNNYLNNLGEPTNYESMEAVIKEYQERWLLQYQQTYQNDLQTLQQFVDSQTTISNIKPLSHGGLNIDTVMITYDYSVEKGLNPLPEIFNSATNSYLVPFVQYNINPIKGNTEDIKRFYKIYKGKSIDSRPQYGTVVLLSDKTKNGNTIYLNVWQGKDYYDSTLGTETDDVYEEARFGTKGGFGKVSISLMVNSEEQSIIRVKFKAPQEDEVNAQTIIRRIHQHMPALTMPGVTQENNTGLTGVPKNIKEMQVSGNFSIYQLNILEVSLFHLIMNDPLFSSYLYLEESGKSFAEKTRLNIHYRGVSADINGKESERKSSVSATLNEEVYKAGDKFYEASTNKEYSVGPTDMQVVTVKITRASSKRVAQQFMNVLIRLFRRYVEYAEQIRQYYVTLIPEYNEVIKAKFQKQQTGETNIRTSGRKALNPNAPLVEQLRTLAPDIFAAGWARNCQPVRRQPKPIVDTNEMETWQNKMISTSQGPQQRQILGFPINEPKVYMVCPDEEYPYPGLIRNKKENKEKYPHLPCCFKTNQLNNPKSALYSYMRGETQIETRQTPPDYVMTTQKLAEPGRKAYINTNLSTFLTQVYSEDPDMSFYRYGVPRSYNSFIHCVALAMENQEYLNSDDSEEWVDRLREELFNISFVSSRMRGQEPHIPGQSPGSPNAYMEKLLPEALKQELYDMNTQDIINRATDNDEFFDPLLYYRALELIFGCNIYVFAMNEENHETGNKHSLLQLPRYKYFHAHPPDPDRPVILILRHWGSERDTLTYPQCELIVEGRFVNKRVVDVKMLFDDYMNTRIYPALNFVARTISWQIYETGGTPVLTSRLNIYSAVNYNTLFGGIPIIAQIVDNAGKARMFALAPEYDVNTKTFGELRIFVNVLPTTPVNAPQFNPLDATRNLPPYEKTIELFGEPISATISTDQKYLTGLWFPMGDIQFGFYCPCKATSWPDFLNKYPNINTNSELAALTINIPRTEQMGISSIQRIKYLSRVSQFIDQIVKYLYLWANQPDNIVQWLSTIGIMLSEPRPDSMQLYQIDQLPRILPAPQAGQDPVQDVLEQLSIMAPAMFYNNKLLIYDQQMLEGLNFQLLRFKRNIEGLDIKPIELRQLQNYYEQKDDYNWNNHTQFLLGTLKEFKMWQQTYVPSSSLQQRTVQNLKNSIQIKLTPNAFAYKEPYIYQRSMNTTTNSSLNPQADRFYLIQNVAGGEFRRALQVAYTWFQEKRNTGFTTEPYEGPAPEGSPMGEPQAITYPVSQTQDETTTTVMSDAPGDKDLVISSPAPATVAGISPVSGNTSSGFNTVPTQPGAVVNTDSNPINVNPIMPAHIIYRISPGGGIIVDVNNTDQELNDGMPLALEILDYGNNHYAAMLPIL